MSSLETENCQLVFEQRKPQVGDHFAGRGEIYQQLTLVFVCPTFRMDVVTLDEYDKRPFYDAWEVRSVKQAGVYYSEQELEFFIRIEIEEEAEWSSATVSYRFFASKDAGKVWNQVSWFEIRERFSAENLLYLAKRG